MRTSPSVSALPLAVRPLAGRERRVVAGGALIAALALLLAFAIVPFARRWRADSAAIDAAREQHDRLRALIADEARIREALDQRRAARNTYAARLASGETAALAAAELQALIGRYAEESSVSINRMSVVGDPTPLEGGLPAIPLQVTAEGDVRGLADFLARLQRGEKLIAIDEITVTAGSPNSDGSHSFIWSLRLRGPYAGPANSTL